MRRYDIVSGILLILSVIDFVLLAPVLVQEKRQACVDVAHIPKDVIPVLGKRVDDEFAKLLQEYAEKLGKLVQSSRAHASSSSNPPGFDYGSNTVVQAPVLDPALSDAHASSSSAPLEPDHESKNLVQEPAPNPASSAANPSPLMEPPSLSDHPEDLKWILGLDEMRSHPPHAFANRPPPRPASLVEPADGWMHDKQPLPSIKGEPVSGPDHAPPSLGDGADELWLKLFGHPENHFFAKPDPELSDAHAPSSSAPLGSDHGSTNVVQEPASNPASLAVNPSRLMEPSSLLSSAASKTSLPVHSGDLDWKLELDEWMGSHAPQSNPKKRPWTSLDLDPHFNWNDWMTNRLPPSGSRPTGGWMGVKLPLPSIPEDPLPASSPDHVPPSPDDGLGKLWLQLQPFDHSKSHFFTKPGSSATRPSSSSLYPAFSDAHASSSSAPLGPGHGSTNVVQEPVPNPASATANLSPLMEPPSPLSTKSSEATLSPDSDLESIYQLDEKLGAQPSPKKRPWTDLDLESDFNRNDRTTNQLPPRPGSRPTGGWTDGNLLLPPIPEELPPVSSPNHAPSSLGDGLGELWLKPFGHSESHFFAKPESFATRPSSSSLYPAFSDAHASSSSAPLGPGHGSTNMVQEPVPNPASSATNPSRLMEPSRPSSPASSEATLSDSDLEWIYELDEKLGAQPSSKKKPWTDLDLDPNFN